MADEALTREAAAVARIYRVLDAMHAWRGWHWWPAADPFEIAVGAILVQNTAWTNVEHALDRLRTAGALTPTAMAALSPDELEALVRPSGQYRQKARKLRAFLDLVERHGSLAALLALDGETLRRELLATWGIGPETADAISAYAAGNPAFVIDAYTIRLFSRLDPALGPPPGAADPYHAWQRWFEARFPRDAEARARFHALIVLHAKHRCRKLRPGCGACALHECCAFARAGAG